MLHPRVCAIALLTGLLGLGSPSVARAQVCLGNPAEDGQISLQAEASSESSYGGRLAMNFNTEYSLDFGVRRLQLAEGRGLVLSGGLGYELQEYEPPVCFTFGVRYERRPTEGEDEASASMIPIGLGIGKRLGSAKAFSLALFVLPEYLYVVRPDPVGEFETFWDELGRRSEGRGVLGLLMASPFLYATGAVEIGTRDNFEPAISLGLGLIF